MNVPAASSGCRYGSSRAFGDVPVPLVQVEVAPLLGDGFDHPAPLRAPGQRVDRGGRHLVREVVDERDRGAERVDDPGRT